MGDRKRESGKILAVRATLPPTEQITLVPCPVCAGGGQRIQKAGIAEYRVTSCRWCSGTGSVPHLLVRLFSRWTRIRAYNVARGVCDT